MMDRKHVRDLKPGPAAVYGLVGAGAVALIVGLAVFAAPRSANALPAYAQKTGQPCGSCHVNTAGGGTLTSLGKAFAANGHKLPSAKGKGKASVSGEVPASSSPIVLDRAQAGAWSLDPPYYSLFLH